MKVTWKVDDGSTKEPFYHSTRISNEELALCETPEEIEDLIEDHIMDDFANKITYTITHIENEPLKENEL